MADKLPRVLGLEELLKLDGPLDEKPPPLVFFTEREFMRLLKGVELLKRPPPAKFGLPTFVPVAGGLVLSRCVSPPGQTCVGQTIPASPDHPGGIFFGCDCKVLDPPTIPPQSTCRLLVDANGLRCVGDCGSKGRECRLGVWRDPRTGVFVMDCRCRPRVLSR